MGAKTFLLTDSSYYVLIKYSFYSQYKERFKKSVKSIEVRLGKDFLRKERSERVLNNEDENHFMSLRSSYLLVFLFDKPFNIFKCSSILDKERKFISQYLGKLPPKGGGGGEAVAKRAGA